MGGHAGAAEQYIRHNHPEGQTFTDEDIAVGTGLTIKQAQQAVAGIRQRGTLQVHVVGHGRYVVDTNRPLTFKGRADSNGNGSRPDDHALFEVIGQLTTGELLVADEAGRAFIATLRPFGVTR